MDNSYLFQQAPDLKLMNSRKQEILNNLKAIQILKDLMQTQYWKRVESSLTRYDFKSDNNLLQFMEGQRSVIHEMKNFISQEQILKNHLTHPEGGQNE